MPNSSNIRSTLRARLGRDPKTPTLVTDGDLRVHTRAMLLSGGVYGVAVGFLACGGHAIGLISVGLALALGAMIWLIGQPHGRAVSTWLVVRLTMPHGRKKSFLLLGASSDALMNHLWDRRPRGVHADDWQFALARIDHELAARLAAADPSLESYLLDSTPVAVPHSGMTIEASLGRGTAHLAYPEEL